MHLIYRISVETNMYEEETTSYDDIIDQWNDQMELEFQEQELLSDYTGERKDNDH